MVRFGPSGNDVLFYEQGFKTSVQAPGWLAGLGLTAMEVNFGRGIKMGDKMAEELGSQAREHNIMLSFHAPYYINLASNDRESVRKSCGYIEKCLKVANIVNPGQPSRLVIHIGSQCDLERAVAIENCKQNIAWVIAELEKQGFSNFLLCIETMGRYKAIGTYQEICEICHVDSRIIPTLDFGHINCIEQGALSREPGRMSEIIEYCIKEIGYEKMKHVHIHFSAIEYTARGEHAHSTLDNPKWAIPFEPLARAIRKYKLEPIIICESQEIMAQDAKRLQEIWGGSRGVTPWSARGCRGRSRACPGR